MSEELSIPAVVRRARAGLSQEAFALALAAHGAPSSTRQAVSAWERGIAPPDRRSYRAILDLGALSPLERLSAWEVFGAAPAALQSRGA